MVEVIMKECFANNLKSARIKAGLSGAELCRRLDGIVSKQAISKYEKGLMLPDSTTLIALANALSVNIDYFFRANHCQIEQVNYRKKQKFSQKRQDALTEKIKDLVERYREIESVLGIQQNSTLPQYNILNPDDVITAVRKLKARWQLGEDGICNLFEILEEHGIKIILIEEDDCFDGVSAYADNYPVMVLNQNACSERKRFTALHELGHLVLRFDDSIPEKDREHHCHRFAGEMLIASEVLKNRVGEKRNSFSCNEIVSIQRQFGISIDAILYRLRDLKIVTDLYYKNYCKKKNCQPPYKEFVEKSRCIEEDTNRFESLVYRAYTNDLISGSKAADLLNIPESEIYHRMKLA